MHPMTQSGSDSELNSEGDSIEMDEQGEALTDRTTPDAGTLDEAETGTTEVIDANVLDAETEGELPPLPPDVFIDVNGTEIGLSALLESLLFVADTPIEPLQVAKALDIKRQVVEEGLTRLDRLYRENGRGLRLLERDDTFQLVTLPEAAPAIEIFLSLDLTTKLSGPALEALAVIAYRQPVTRAQVEAVRGVDCAGVLRSLLQRGLVEEIGRLDTVGRPILYGVTDLFMHHFGLTGMNELPPLGTEAADTLWAATELADIDTDTDTDVDTDIEKD
jgi:segregation and condensation protein B